MQSFKDAKMLNASHRFQALLQPRLLSAALCSAAALYMLVEISHEAATYSLNGTKNSIHLLATYKYIFK